jgi:heavy metal translocating P-type ATPase
MASTRAPSPQTGAVRRPAASGRSSGTSAPNGGPVRCEYVFRGPPRTVPWGGLGYSGQHGRISLRNLPALNVSNGLLAGSVAGLIGGGVCWVVGAEVAADVIWAVTAFGALVPVTVSVVRDLLRRSAGVDVIAILAIVGALLLGEYLAGAVIGLMLATGRVLEEYAANRAERELSSLLQRAPRIAHRLVGNEVEDVAVEVVVVGDRLIVKEGDVLPVDGLVTVGPAVLDEAALTGESRLVERAVGDQVRSGTANAGSSFHMMATTTSAESTYSGIIRMVSSARASKAPLVRLADRYAQFFVPITLVTSGVAWIVSADPVRALAVLVVATPCPLLLAAPVAIVSGVSRAAKRGIVVKGGAAIETLARGRALYLDKTGTITLGAPRLQRVAMFDRAGDSSEMLRLAGSLDQMSSHVLAAALVRSARDRGLALALPVNVSEKAGFGVEGTVEDTPVRLGNFAWIFDREEASTEQHQFRRRVMRDEGSVIFVALHGSLAGAFIFDDPIRPEAPRVLRVLKHLGISESVMLTGDNVAVAESVGAAIGVDRVLAGLTPEEKVQAVQQSRNERVTLMIGDGINDAPALAAADVGIAMGARGATSSSEAADVVIVVDRMDRLVEAVEIAQRSRSIAVQSMLFGMGLSFVAMGFATFGLLPPVVGAVLQEAIDAAAIINALRALRGGRGAVRPKIPVEMGERLRAEHRELAPRVEQLRDLADSMGEATIEGLGAKLEEIRGSIARIVAHENVDERDVYRMISTTLGGEDPLAAMSRTHQEIFHLARAFERLVGDLTDGGPDPEDMVDIRRTLYALQAVLRLNIAQEEELYLSLDRDATGAVV